MGLACNSSTLRKREGGIYHCTPLRMPKILNADNTKCRQGCGATGTLVCCWWEYETVRPLWMKVWQFLTKLNILLPRDPEITLLGIYSNELKT